MAEIRPFRAIRYNRLKIKDLLNVVTPPYDVIDASLQDALYARDPYNFVRLDLTRVDADADPQRKYTLANETLQQWRADEVLVRDDAPAVYVYHQTFMDGDREILRKGFISTVRIHDYADKVVLPHERTLRGPKIDRLELMKATHAQMSQIFLLYNDPDLTIDDALDTACGHQPNVDIATADGIRHQLWVVTDPDTLQFVQKTLADEQLLIADGHHRYETAVAYRDLEDRSDATPRPRDYAMAYLANGADPGLLVWPTHRAVHDAPGFEIDAWIRKLSPYFDVMPLDAPATKAALDVLDQHADQNAFVALHDNGSTRRGWLITLRTADAQTVLNALDVVPAARELDVTVLHEIILDRITGIDRDAQAKKTNIRYPRNPEEVDEELARADTDVVILMNPTPIEKIREVCVTGGFMPQKSTYFYPKVLSGLVVNDLNDF